MCSMKQESSLGADDARGTKRWCLRKDKSLYLKMAIMVGLKGMNPGQSVLNKQQVCAIWCTPWSSDSSYSRSRSRSLERRYQGKRPSRRTPPRYNHPPKHSTSHERKRRESRDYARSRSRSPSSSPRRARGHESRLHERAQQKEAPSNFPLDTSKVLSGNFNQIPGLDFMGRGNQKAKKERSYSPQPEKSSQDLDMRLRQLETQSSEGSRSRSVAEQPKSVQRGYYESKGSSQQDYQSRSKSPGDQRYEPSKERGMSPNGQRYREQQRPDYGIRVEVQRKEHSPKRRKLDPSLVVIPRRKDEGLRPIFDRPEIIVRILEDDPELYPEKYERFACWRKSPDPEPDRKPDQTYSSEKQERSRRHGRRKEKERSLSPGPLQETTVVMKPFTVFEKYEQSLRNRPGVLQDIDEPQFPLHRSQGFNQSPPPMPLTVSTDSFSSNMAMDRMMSSGNDLRHDLDVRRHILSDATSPGGRLGKLPGDRREILSDRRPIRERLGEIDDGRQKSDTALPDFRKEVEELQQLDPLSNPRGLFFQHDDRDKGTPPDEEKRLDHRPTRGYVPNYYRGRGRGFYRGNYRGNNFRANFNRGFRGNYRGFSNRGGFRGTYTSSWKHDKFDVRDKDKERHKDKERREKREKKEKKSKSSDKEKKKSKKSKKTPDRSKSEKKGI